MTSGRSKGALVFEGWSPVVNGAALPETHHTKRDAIRRGRQVARLLREASAMEVDVVFTRNEVRYKDVKKFVSLEDFREALRIQGEV